MLAFLLLLGVGTSAIAQARLGYATTTVNLRQQPTAESPVLRSIKQGSGLFVTNEQQTNGFYHVVDIETNTEGYIHHSYVQLDQEIPPTGESFNPVGSSTGSRPMLKVFNDSQRAMTLKLNNTIYTFSPQERRVLILSPGGYSYRASAPGVIPDYGTDTLHYNLDYNWRFSVGR